MAHGTPDWNITNAAATVFRVDDVGEAAVRLGAIDRFDRRGDVLFMDGFEDGLGKWATNFGGASSIVATTVLYGRSGAWSALMTQDPAGGSFSQMTHYEPFPVLSRMAVEFSYSVPDSTGSVELTVTVYDGVQRTVYDVLLDYQAGHIQYTNSAGVLTTIAGAVVPVAGPALFHTVKLVFDATARVYVRLLVNNQAIDLPLFGAWVQGAANIGRLQVLIQNHGRAGFTDTIYVDDVIITQNEP